MHFTPIAIIFAFLTASALAVDNCKCQDARGQYNELTSICCDEMGDQGLTYPGKNHQCTDWTIRRRIDGTEFDQCCKAHGVGGAFCWN